MTHKSILHKTMTEILVKQISSRKVKSGIRLRPAITELRRTGLLIYFIIYIFRHGGLVTRYIGSF